MKKSLQYGIVLIFLGLTLSVNAQVKNYWGLHFQGAEWSLLTDNESTVANSKGIQGGIGFDYEMHHRHFLFTTGVTLSAGQTVFGIGADSARLENEWDLDPLNPMQFDYVYQISGRKDYYRNVSVQIPVMAGAQVDRFYFLAGLKFNYLAPLNTSAVSATITTYGDYHGTIGGHGAMPGRGFYENIEHEQAIVNNSALDIDASVEIGWRLGFFTKERGFDVPKQKRQFRLGFFADYGLLSIYSQRSKTPLTEAKGPYVLPADASDRPMLSTKHLNLNHVLATQQGGVHNLMVGVKFTMLFQLPERGTCVICRDSYLSSRRSYRGGVHKADD